MIVLVYNSLICHTFIEPSICLSKISVIGFNRDEWNFINRFCIFDAMPIMAAKQILTWEPIPK